MIYPEKPRTFFGFLYICSMDKPVVSIITITFNAERELPPTLASIRRQSFHDFEHIIVDGASTDSTISLARKSGVDGCRIISEPDEGLYDAMNKGIDMAKGDYLLFLNAGDAFADKNTLQKYADAIISSKPDIVYGDTIIVDWDRNVLRPRHLSVPEELTFESFADGMLVCHQAFCVRRSIAPYYDLQYRFSADYDWTVKCLQRSRPGHCVNLKSVVIHYLDDGMTDKNKRASLIERFNIMRKHYGLAKAVGKHISFLPRMISRKINADRNGKN